MEKSRDLGVQFVLLEDNWVGGGGTEPGPQNITQKRINCVFFFQFTVFLLQTSSLDPSFFHYIMKQADTGRT